MSSPYDCKPTGEWAILGIQQQRQVARGVAGVHEALQIGRWNLVDCHRQRNETILPCHAYGTMPSKCLHSMTR